VCFEFDNTPANLAANDYLLGSNGGTDNICGVYGPGYQLVSKPGNKLDPWFSRDPSRTVRHQGRLIPRKYCKNPSPGYRAIVGYNERNAPLHPVPKWETASGTYTWGVKSSAAPLLSTCMDIRGFDPNQIVKRTAVPHQSTNTVPTHSPPTAVLPPASINARVRDVKPSILARTLRAVASSVDTHPSNYNETAQELEVSIGKGNGGSGIGLIRRQSSLGGGFLDPNAYRFMEGCEEELNDVDACDNDPIQLCGNKDTSNGQETPMSSLSIPHISASGEPANTPDRPPPPPITTNPRPSSTQVNQPPSESNPLTAPSTPTQQPDPPQGPTSTQPIEWPHLEPGSVPVSANGAPFYMILIVKYPSGEYTNIGQNMYGDRAVGPEPDICKAKPLFELPVSSKIMVHQIFKDLKVFGDDCNYIELEGKLWASTKMGDFIGTLQCRNYKDAICSKISDGKKAGELKCPNIGVSFFNAVTCVWKDSLLRYPTISYEKLGFGNGTIDVLVAPAS
jgi:hypothetical protein